MEILQVAMTIDKTRQNGFASDINDLSVGRNRNCAAPTDGLEPACPDNDDGILDRRPAGAIDQSSTLHHECFLYHVLFSPTFRSQVLTGLRAEFFTYMLILPDF